jgi:hypothetical protein
VRGGGHFNSRLKPGELLFLGDLVELFIKNGSYKVYLSPKFSSIVTIDTVLNPDKLKHLEDLTQEQRYHVWNRGGAGLDMNEYNPGQIEFWNYLKSTKMQGIPAMIVQGTVGRFSVVSDAENTDANYDPSTFLQTDSAPVLYTEFVDSDNWCNHKKVSKFLHVDDFPNQPELKVHPETIDAVIIYNSRKMF